jgi:hypothetical protein
MSTADSMSSMSSAGGAWPAKSTSRCPGPARSGSSIAWPTPAGCPRRSCSTRARSSSAGSWTSGPIPAASGCTSSRLGSRSRMRVALNGIDRRPRRIHTLVTTRAVPRGIVRMAPGASAWEAGRGETPAPRGDALCDGPGRGADADVNRRASLRRPPVPAGRGAGQGVRRARAERGSARRSSSSCASTSPCPRSCPWPSSRRSPASASGPRGLAGLSGIRGGRPRRRHRGGGPPRRQAVE